MSLRTLELHQHPDADSIVRLQVPVEAVDQRYRVIILIEPESAADYQRPWSAGFFEETYGQWKGELERGPQGEYEQRNEF